MKQYLLSFTVVLLLCAYSLSAQKKDNKVEIKKTEYEIKDVKILPHTSVKNQASSGTCWSFSGIALFESEIMRIKGEADSVNLSPMWVVRHIYKEKVEKYVRMHGNINLSAGGAFF
ncbi:MAG: aminopeptidase, partial [Prevotellaceae bacterium]|nr:aminopeptidase [Prevotellaceae bacterium]